MTSRDNRPLLVLSELAFTGLLASTFEVANCETNGFVIGSVTKGGSVYLAEAVQPYQAVKRSRKATSSCFAARKRAIGAVLEMEGGMIGEFHSHVHDLGDKFFSELSEEDITYVRETLKGEYPPGRETHMEIVVSVQRQNRSVSSVSVTEGATSVYGDIPIPFRNTTRTYHYNVSAWVISKVPHPPKSKYWLSDVVRMRVSADID